MRFTLEELVAARLRARAAGRPVARYIREAALDSGPRTLRLQAHDDVVHELSAIVRRLDATTTAGAVTAVACTRAAVRALLVRLTA